MYAYYITVALMLLVLLAGIVTMYVEDHYKDYRLTERSMMVFALTVAVTVAVIVILFKYRGGL